MALVKDIISLPLQLGIDTENHPVLVDKTRFVALQNTVFDKTALGQLHKRFGYQPMPQTVVSGSVTSIGTVTALGRFNSELECLGAGSQLFTYSPSNFGWVQRGAVPQLQVQETPLAASIYSSTNPDLGNWGNGGARSTTVVVYEQNGCAWLRVVDENNHATIQVLQLVTPYNNTFTPKVVTTGGATIYVLASDAAGNLYAWTVNAATPGAPITSKQLISFGLNVDEATSETVYDAAWVNSRLCVAGGDTNGYVSLWSFTSALVQITTLSPAVAISPAALNCNALGTALAVTLSGAGLIQTNFFASPSLVPGAALLVDAAARTSPRLTSVAFTYGGTEYLEVFYERPPEGIELSQINTAICTSSGLTLAPTPFCVSLELASQPWVSNGVLYVVGAYASSVQPTLFVLSAPVALHGSTTSVVAKLWAGTGGQAPTNGRLPNVMPGAGADVITACTNAVESISTGASTSLAFVYGISELSLAVGSGSPVALTQLGQNLHIATEGLLSDYDGVNLVEHNFNLFPEAVSTSFATTQLAVIIDALDINVVTVNTQTMAGRIAIPDNGARPGGPVGQLINVAATEYLTFNAQGYNTGATGNAAQPVVVYFVVDGVGPLPYFNAITVACNITSSMSAIEVATVLYATLSSQPAITDQYALSFTATPQTSVYTPQYINFQTLAQPGTYPVSLSPPSLNLVCSATQVNAGTGTTLSTYNTDPAIFGCATITGIPASLISSGQYVVTTCPSTAFLAQGYGYATIYLWFSNPNARVYTGIGNQDVTSGDPDPFGIGSFGGSGSIGGWNCHYSTTIGNFIGIEIPLTGNESEATVASYMTAALNAVTSTFGLGINGVTTVVATTCITYSSNMSATNNTWTNNPNYVGMGQGYIGQVVDNTTGAAEVNYQAVYTWVDAQNELHQSAPSVAAPVYVPVYAALGEFPSGTPVQTITLGPITTGPAGAGTDTLTIALTTTSPNLATVKVVQFSGAGSSAVLTGQNLVITIAFPNYTPAQIAALIQAEIAAVSPGWATVTVNGAGTDDWLFLPPSGPTFFTGGTFTAPLSTIQQTVPASAVISVGVLPLCLTQKQNVNIALYRTISDQPNIAYQITPPASQLLLNMPGTEQEFYQDFSADVDNAGLTTGIGSNLPLYTSGGIIADNAPPGFSFLCNHQNRLWGVSAENPLQLWYSQGFESGYEVAFSTDQTVNINASVGQTVGGDVTALASMDGYLVVFQLNQVWNITGQGPNAAGTGAFNLPQLVASSSAIGCRDPGSVVLLPDGLVFKSMEGFYLLDRQLGLHFIGAPVKAYNNDVVTTATVLNNSTQVVFVSESGTTLMYDYFYNAWSTYTNHEGVASIIDPAGTYNYVDTRGIICTQTPGEYLDANGEGYAMSATTAWLRVQNIQGFQRIYKAFFLGQFLGTQPYRVTTQYNYQDAVVDNFVYQPLAGTEGIGVWGDDTTWGDSTWGTAGTPVSYSNSIQFRDFPSQQLCEAVQFTFTDLAPFAPFATPALNALDLEVGVRRGGFKRGPGASPAHSIG